jgi:hypothetical protein
MRVTVWTLLIALAASINLARAETLWTRHVIDGSSRGADGVRLADVDGDRRLDIVTGWEQGGVIRVYRHPGEARVRDAWPAVTVGKVRSPEDAVFADLDGDGRLDVVSCCEGKQRTVQFHFAPRAAEDYWTASAWTTATVPCTAGKQLWMYALPMDIDGQHGIDVVVGSKESHAAIGWLQAPAEPRDVSQWSYHRLREAGWMMSLESHDMDSDGDLDLLASDRKQSRRGVFWLENPGAMQARRHAGWNEHAIGGSDREVMFLARGRIGTRRDDSIACAVRGGDLTLFHPEASGWQMEAIPLPAGYGTGKGVGIGDLDGDGDGDLAFSCEHAKGQLAGVGWFEYTGQASQPWRARALGGPEGVKFDRIELLDLDSDGDLDLLTCEEADNLGVIWYENPQSASSR